MNWLNFALALGFLCGGVLVTGLPLALALRQRGFNLVVFSLPAALATVALAQLISAATERPWQPWWPVAVSLALAVPLMLITYVLRRRRPLKAAYTPAQDRFALTATTLGALAMGVFVMSALRSPGAVSQTYDANFHLNLADTFVATGLVSPLDVELASPGSPVFYPALWHALVALTVNVTGVSVPIATNALMFFALAAVWPVGVQYLSRTLFGPGRAFALAAALAAVALPNGPYIPATYGVLFPVLLGVVLLPTALAALVQLLRLTTASERTGASRFATFTLLISTACTAVLAQPSMLHSLLVFVVVFAAAALVKAVRQGTGTLIVGRTLLLTAVLGATGAAWLTGITTDNTWRIKQTLIGGLFDVFGGAPRYTGDALLITLLLVIGILLCLKRRTHRFLLVAYAVCVALFLICDTLQVQQLRTMFTGPWYNDNWRLALLLGIATLPLIIIGIRALLLYARLAWRSLCRMRGHKTGRRGFTVMLAVVALVLFSHSGMFAVHSYLHSSYDADYSAYLLSKPEREAFEYLARNADPGTVVVNNPWNGGAMVKAFTELEALFPHPGGNYPSGYYELVDGIAEGTPAACERAAEYGARYVLDFGDEYVFNAPERTRPFEPITKIDENQAPALTEVFAAPEVRVYKITGCGF